MNLCIIQARMGSSRLPGKVMRDVNGKNILQNIVERLKPSAFINTIVVATTTEPADDAICDFCKSNNILFFRGSEADVLDRFYKCALQHAAADGDYIIRICADNPLHSWKVVDQVAYGIVKLGLDYFSNSNQEPHYLEDGFDVEIATFKALENAWKNAELQSEREHVMPYIKNSGRFLLGWRKTNAQYHFKLSVDTENDLEAVRMIYSELQSEPDFSIDEVVNLLLRKPQILEVNKESIINAGYTKSLREDRKIE